MKALLAVLLLVAAVAGEKQCPSEQESNWDIEELLRHEECDKFYKCTYGKPVEQKCFSGLYFNLDTWECDWPANVDCDGRVDPADKSKSEETEEAPQDSNNTDEKDTSEESNQTSEESNQTSEESKQTSEESKQSSEESKQTSEEYKQTSEESAQSPEKPADESDEDCDEESEEQELEFQENGCPVNPHVHWLLPHEDDCNQFYYCVWGKKELRNCPASLHFNRQLQVCDWPTDAGCAVSTNKHFGGRVAAFRSK